MNSSMEKIRERMVDYLTARGVNAAPAWPIAPRKVQGEPVAVVSLRGFQGETAGFQDYLGQRYDGETGQWRELYGMKAQVTFGLDIYAETALGEEAVEAAFHKLAAALALGSPDGMAVGGVSCGETGYDRDGKRMKRPVQAVCTAYLYAVEEPGGAFTDFEIRGGLKE